MEAANRQSGLHSLINRDHFYHPATMAAEREQQPYTSISTPSATSPTAMYPNHPPPPYSQSNSTPLSAHSLSTLMSPSQPNLSDSRRNPVDSKDAAQPPQRLPSIQEALYTPNSMAAPPRAVIEPSPPRAYPGYPQPPPTPTSRANSFDGTAYPPQIGIARRASPPNAIHPTPYSRSEQVPTSPYENTRYPPLPSIRTALPTQATPYSGPSPEFLKHEKDLRTIAPVSAGYSQQPASNGYHSDRPNGPKSMSTGAYSPQSPYLPQRPYRPRYEPDDAQAKIGENPVTQKVYGPVVKRHLDYWDIEIELNNMKTCGDEVARISSILLADAQRNTNHGSMPERMPSLHDVDLMRIQQEKLAQSIQRVTERVVAQGQYQEGPQNGLSQPGKPAEDYSHEELSWDEGRSMGGYGGHDAKKRRGRAAPPGRCHSCNRAETPEWRRGPDGARTLCNACGLHYAKLTRKLSSKQAQNGGSALRPTSIGDVSPRS